MAYQIKNWSKFQHYKSGRGAPPWIKLYRDLLNDPEWFELPPEAAKFLVSCWILAAETDGILPDSKTLAFRLRVDSKKIDNLLSLCNHWIIQDDSTMLASCLHDAIPETETETETETEREKETEKEKETDLRKPERSAVPYSEIVDLYHQKLPMLAQVYKMTTLRKNKVKLLWHEELQSLNAWENYFDFISQSAFLTGKTIGKDGRAFIADFDFIVNQTNFVKIAEEKYHGKKV